jgi:predicted alpha/beta-fold hydrolase
MFYILTPWQFFSIFGSIGAMAVLIYSASFYAHNFPETWKVVIFIIAVLKINSHLKKQPLELVYSKSSHFGDFVRQTKFNKIEFQPYWLTYNNHLQSALYMASEMYYRNFRNLWTIDRELLKLRDGGTVALDWIEDQYGGIPSQDDKRDFPILVIVSGLAGGKDNAYNVDIIK